MCEASKGWETENQEKMANLQMSHSSSHESLSTPLIT